MSIDFGKTYLYKLHLLTNMLDKAFEQALRRHTEIGLTQFSLLFAINNNEAVNQKKLARFLEVSTPAISRQIEIAKRQEWITVAPSPHDRHGNLLCLTDKGKQLVNEGLAVLERDVFQIFADHNRQANLMEHIDLLSHHTRQVLYDQSAVKKLRTHERSKI